MFFLRGEGVIVKTGLSYRRIERGGEGVALTVLSEDREETLTASRVLAATGRNPNTGGLNLADAGVDLDARGAVLIDDRMRTTRAGIYAAGDVTGRDQFVTWRPTARRSRRRTR